MTQTSATCNDTMETPNLTETEILNYLRRHPKFFSKHNDILKYMEIPERWTEDGIVDMQKFLLDRRSDEIDDLRDCAQEVIETSRSNLSVQTRVHAATLALISANDFKQLIQVLVDDTPFFLDIEAISIGFEPIEINKHNIFPKAVKKLEEGCIEKLIGIDQNFRLFPNFKDDGTLFGSSSKNIVSGLLSKICLPNDYGIGLLCLGSSENIFHRNQGTELVNFFVRVVERLIQKKFSSTVSCKD